MDISSTRFAALLKEAMTPPAVPLAKADPARTALIKALVAPPAPSGAPVRPTAPTLPMLLPATAARAQQTALTEIVQAYLALSEPDRETVGDAASATATRRPTDGDTAQRGLALPLAKVDDGATARPAPSSWLTLVAPVVSPPRRASIAGATTMRGHAGATANSTAQPENRRMSGALMPVAAGFLAAVIVGFVLLVLR